METRYSRLVATVKKRYGTKDPDWLKNRFEQGSENGFAYFEGSTYARNSDVNNESVLDAVTARIDRKDEGDCIGVRRLATFDGLGHGFDAKESASISQENKIMSRALDQELSQQSGINLKDAFLKASARAFNERKQLGKEEFNSGCAVSLAVLEHDKKTEKMKLQLVKSGDTMTLVLDSKTLAIKKILPACQRITPDETKNTKKIPSPAHLANANPDLVKSQTFDVDPNDFIVELTDGFTDELQCESKIVTSKGLSRLETQLTPHALDVPLLP